MSAAAAPRGASPARPDRGRGRGRGAPRRAAHAIERVEKPWGWELWWARSDRYVGKVLHVRRGAALSYQFHRRKDETIYLLRGELAVELAPGGRRRRRWVMRQGEALRIRPGDHHRMTAITTCDVLEASTPEVEDIVRLEDRYGRADVPARLRARMRRS